MSVVPLLATAFPYYGRIPSHSSFILPHMFKPQNPEACNCLVNIGLKTVTDISQMCLVPLALLYSPPCWELILWAVPGVSKLAGNS